MDITTAKAALDKIIKKSRVHLYKPIQLAEILYKDRALPGSIDLSNLETYRNPSKKWRDDMTCKLIGATCTSSAKFQDNIFEKNAVPPQAIVTLGEENRNNNGIVELYIYSQLKTRYTQLSNAIEYLHKKTPENLVIEDFINLFWAQPGLKRSIDKVYEIIVYALFVVLVYELDVKIEISVNSDKLDLLKEFSDFAEKVLFISPDKPKSTSPAKIYRVGVTNAADRGLDMWANFGPAIQIKHVTLTDYIAESIVDSVSADRIVIVCKDAEKKYIESIIGQLGWASHIQSIIVESDLINWYEKGLRGTFKDIMGEKIIQALRSEMQNEFPVANLHELDKLFLKRGYNNITLDKYWQI